MEINKAEFVTSLASYGPFKGEIPSRTTGSEAKARPVPSRKGNRKGSKNFPVIQMKNSKISAKKPL